MALRARNVKITEEKSEQFFSKVKNTTVSNCKQIKSNEIKQHEFVDKVLVNHNELPIKQFASRQSLLSDLCEEANIRCVYNLLITVLIGLFFHTAANDLFKNNSAELGFRLIRTGFAKFHYLILIWISMFSTTFVVYFGFKWWSVLRYKLLQNQFLRKSWDTINITLYLFYILLYTFGYGVAVIEFDMPPAASFALAAEICRFLMKSYSFVRTNAPEVLSSKPNTKAHFQTKISNYFYFLWIPTLVYKDNYPRTEKIRWKFVATCCAEFFGCLLLMSYMFGKFIIPSYEAYGKTAYDWKYLLTMTITNSASSLIFILAVFYGVMHSWMNVFAELFMFDDRLFYKDWWASSSYERYFRTWNVIVHDFLYTYIYKDFCDIVTDKNKVISKNVVLFVSAIYHDYLMVICLRFYSPVLFLLFYGMGMFGSVVRIKEYWGSNVIFLCTLALGFSLNCTMYSMEYFCRANQPRDDDTFWYYIKPKLFQCLSVDK